MPNGVRSPPVVNADAIGPHPPSSGDQEFYRTRMARAALGPMRTRSRRREHGIVRVGRRAAVHIPSDELVAEFLKGLLPGCLIFPDFAKVDLRQGGPPDSRAEGPMDSFEIAGLFEQTFLVTHTRSSNWSGTPAPFDMTSTALEGDKPTRHIDAPAGPVRAGGRADGDRGRTPPQAPHALRSPRVC